MNASPPRVVLTLTAFGLLAGLLLAVAYRVTLPIIQANQAEALRQAVFQVLPGTTRLEPLIVAAGGPQPAGGGTPDLFAGYDDSGALVGYAIPGEGAGFQDTIRLLYGYDPARKRIVGMRILDSRETPGLGDKIFKDPAFAKEFLDLDFSQPLQVVKGGGTGGHEVDAITGATISSKAVVRIINETRSKVPER